MRYSEETARYLVEMEKVEGWLWPTTAHVIADLLVFQSEAGLRGNVMEIGVHHGKLFIILALGTNETALAIDLFDMQDQNIDKSGKGDFGVLSMNLGAYAPMSNVKFLRANSLELGAEFCRANWGMRFISVDGGHTRECTDNDLRIAQAVACDGAVVALDDIYRIEWSGVTAGLARYFHRGGALVPFAFTPNKILMTTSADWADRYRERLGQHFRMGTPQQFFEFNRVAILPEDSAHLPANFGASVGVP